MFLWHLFLKLIEAVLLNNEGINIWFGEGFVGARQEYVVSSW